MPWSLVDVASPLPPIDAIDHLRHRTPMYSGVLPKKAERPGSSRAVRGRPCPCQAFRRQEPGAPRTARSRWPAFASHGRLDRAWSRGGTAVAAALVCEVLAVFF
jgi:hypothetical protein